MQRLIERPRALHGYLLAKRLAVLSWVVICSCGGGTTVGTPVTDSGSLEVTVTDSSGGYVSGSTIEASSGTSAARAATTDARDGGRPNHYGETYWITLPTRGCASA